MSLEMDEVLSKFENTFGVQGPKEDKTQFERLYKNWGRLGHQEERRKEILETQKSCRNNKCDKIRGILDFEEQAETDTIFKTPKAFYRPSIYVAGFSRAPPQYRDVLMLSEWLIEKPDDFHENWLVAPCPKGNRVLLVANRGTTKCYSKYGQFMFECKTILPGGSHVSNKKNACCLLDCFFVEKPNTMLVMDILAWNHQQMTDGETEFRRFWLQEQLKEINGLDVITKNNRLIFRVLPWVDCSPESFKNFMKAYPPFPEPWGLSLDGLLFYHKRARYIAGETPLVGWLYPFMVPEVLGEDIEVNRVYVFEKPLEYVNFEDYIQKFNEKMLKKRKTKEAKDALHKQKKDAARAAGSEVDMEPDVTSPVVDTLGAEMDAETNEAAAANATSTSNEDQVA